MSKVKTTQLKIIEVFNQFAIEVNGKVEMYDTSAEAQAVIDSLEDSIANRLLADSYCDSMNWVDKNKANKSNIITGFLNYVNVMEATDEADAPRTAEESAKVDEELEEIFNTGTEGETPAGEPGLVFVDDIPGDAEATDFGDDEITF